MKIINTGLRYLSKIRKSLTPKPAPKPALIPTSIPGISLQRPQKDFTSWHRYSETFNIIGLDPFETDARVAQLRIDFSSGVENKITELPRDAVARNLLTLVTAKKSLASFFQDTSLLTKEKWDKGILVVNISQPSGRYQIFTTIEFEDLNEQKQMESATSCPRSYLLENLTRNELLEILNKQ